MSQQKIRQQKAMVLAQQQQKSYRCFVCEEELDHIFDWEVSHLQAKSQGGSMSLSNTEVCCLQCNRDMGSCHIYAYILVFFPHHSLYSQIEDKVQSFTGLTQLNIEKDIQYLSNPMRPKTKRLQKRLWFKQFGKKQVRGICFCCHQTLQNPDVANLFICQFDQDLFSQVLVCSSQCLAMKEPWQIYLRRHLLKIIKSSRSFFSYCRTKRQKLEY